MRVQMAAGILSAASAANSGCHHFVQMCSPASSFVQQRQANCSCCVSVILKAMRFITYAGMHADRHAAGLPSALRGDRWLRASERGGGKDDGKDDADGACFLLRPHRHQQLLPRHQEAQVTACCMRFHDHAARPFSSVPSLLTECLMLEFQ